MDIQNQFLQWVKQTCPTCAVLLSSQGCPARIIRSSLSPSWTVQVDLSGQNVQAILSPLFCPDYPVLAVLNLATLLRLSCPSCSVLPVMFCPLGTVQNDLWGRFVQADMSRLCCPRCPVPAVLSRRACHGCPIPTVLSSIPVSACPVVLH